MIDASRCRRGRTRLTLRRLVGLVGGLILAVDVGCSGNGAPQYPGGPPPVAEVYGQCAFCHDELATRMVVFGGHKNFKIKCETCHSQDLTPGEVGPNHRSVPTCPDCHTKQMTHMDPAAGTPQVCQVCHDPHGSPNLYLVNEQITDPSDTVHDIDFTNLSGYKDGSFASVTDPGSGVCEVCHTTTLFYRSDGSGAPHFTNTCTVCHTHAAAFAP